MALGSRLRRREGAFAPCVWHPGQSQGPVGIVTHLFLMRKLLLKCGYALGDVVMLTAAVRDLHHWHPGRFVTDVRTPYPDLWQNNPNIEPLDEDDPDVEQIECAYPLIDRCNKTPYHCLHGFIEFFNDRLGLGIKPTAFHGDVHLSRQEKAWYSQVREVTRTDIPFWIVAAGGKYDVTIKWWQTERYQAVVDHFRGRIQFVQVGSFGHHHPKLAGVMDLRGKTSLRELIRLVHHAQGVLCPVTSLMHLASAVETRHGRPPKRPCVVVAGGREPAHWEAYPDHQFIHTNGALRCCANGGCWKDRTLPLRDGDSRDRPRCLCVDVVNGLPRCMDIITPAEVIRRIETYFNGGALKYLSPRQQTAARRGIAATADNPFDQQSLHLSSAGIACDRFIATIPACPDEFADRGIVICGGGVTYFTNAWVCINRLRQLGCHLPIQVWHLGRRELDARMKALLAPLGVECVDAHQVRKRFPVRRLHGWELKPYAILRSRFREVMLLDADNVPVVNPEYLFDTPQYQATGAIFWPDRPLDRTSCDRAAWRSCGLRQPSEPEFESGQIVVDKQRCWAALRLALWFNEHSDFYYRHVYGDKETFHLAFRKLRKSYSLVPTPMRELEGTMCQFDFAGRLIFQHRSRAKWDLLLPEKKVEGFWHERECRACLKELRQRWDGGMNLAAAGLQPARTRPGVVNTHPLKIEIVMLSTPARAKQREQTLANLARTDWRAAPLQALLEETGPGRREAARLALEECLKRGADYVLLVGDDSDFNVHLRHNLLRWPLLQRRAVALASLHNPRVRGHACDLENRARVVHPRLAGGGQAYLLSRDVVRHLAGHWHQVCGPRELKIARLAARRTGAVYFHAPSLVRAAVKGGVDDSLRPALDFDRDWAA